MSNSPRQSPDGTMSVYPDVFCEPCGVWMKEQDYHEFECRECSRRATVTWSIEEVGHHE